MYNIPGKQVKEYSINENRAAVLFVFTSPEQLSYDHHDIEKQKEILIAKYENTGWKCNELLSKMDKYPDFFFDVVSKIQINRWSKSRVSLVRSAARRVGEEWDSTCRSWW